MSTRKIKDAVDLSTGEKVYYKGHAKATFFADGRNLEDTIGDYAKIVVMGAASATSRALKPNYYYKWGTVTSLTLTLETPANAEEYSEYMFQFTSGSTPTTLSLPSTVKWVAEPNIEANKTYQVSILNNIGIIIGVS